MEIKKKELLLTILLIVVFLVGAISLTSFAAENSDYNQFLNSGWSNISNDDELNNENIPQNIQIKDNENKNDNVNTNDNTPGELANTGLESLPIAVIAICGISAIFAYKKIREYKAY